MSWREFPQSVYKSRGFSDNPYFLMFLFAFEVDFRVLCGSLFLLVLSDYSRDIQ